MVAGEDRILTFEIRHRQPVDKTYSCYPWERSQPLDQALLHNLNFRVFGGGVAWNRNPESLKLFGLTKARVDLTHRLKSANHQPGTDKQYERKRHLNDCQTIASNIPIAAGA